MPLQCEGLLFKPEACYEPLKIALLKDCSFILQKKDNGMSSNTCKFLLKWQNYEKSTFSIHFVFSSWMKTIYSTHKIKALYLIIYIIKN